MLRSHKKYVGTKLTHFFLIMLPLHTCRLFLILGFLQKSRAIHQHLFPKFVI